jgi:hypothetical protein
MSTSNPAIIDIEEGKYNARDVLGMCRMYKPLLDAVIRNDVAQVYLIDADMAHLARQMTRKGIPIDLKERERVGEHLRQIRDAAIEELRPYTEGENRKLFIDWCASFYAAKPRKGEPAGGMIAPNGLVYSNEMAFQERVEIRRAEVTKDLEKEGVQFTKRVYQAAIMRVAGVPLTELSDDGWPKVNKEILEDFSYHAAAKSLRNFLLTSATIRTFIEGQEVAADGSLHPEWSIHKITGRWGSSPNCFDGTTEVLTPQGWICFDALPEGLEVAQFDKDTHEIKFVLPTQYIKKHYVGDMISISHPMFDLLVTPDHRMLTVTADQLTFSVCTAKDFNKEAYSLVLTATQNISAIEKPTVRLVNNAIANVLTIPWSAPVYCISVPSTFILVRKNGKVVIAGQCQNWSKRAGGGLENIRAMICAPPGHIFVGADQKQLEARLLAGASQDTWLCSVVRDDNADIHSAFAAIAFPDNWPILAETYAKHKKDDACGGSPNTKCHLCKERSRLRDLTKRLEYGAFYGGSAKTLWESVAKEFQGIKLQAIVKFLETVNAQLPGLLAWRQAVLQKAIATGEIRSPILGRRQTFPLDRVEPTVAYNFIPQSGGADLWALGAQEFCRRWDQTKDDARIIHNGHDSVLILTKENFADTVAKDVHECWEREWNGVRFLMDTKIGQRFSEV